MVEMNAQDLSKVINLYKNAKFLEKLAQNKNNNNIMDEEFYLIDRDWIANFKNIFKYNFIIEKLKNKCRTMENIKEEDIEKIKIKGLQVNSEEKRNIKKIKNSSIIGNLSGEDIPFVPYYYKDFCLIHHSYYNKIMDGYCIKNEDKIKADIFILNKTFAIKLPNNMIEVGNMETPFKYDPIRLFWYDSKIDYDKEITDILSEGLNNYLIKRNKRSDELQNSLIIKIYDNVLSQEKNVLNINKKGLKNFASADCSRLNAIIQFLASIEEIYNYLQQYGKNFANIGMNNYNNNSEDNIFEKLNHIYIFTSYFYIALNNMYKNQENVSLEDLDIIINFMDKDCSTKDLYNYLLLILQLLHNELIVFPYNFEQENLVSYNSAFGDRQASLEQFYAYCSNTYKPSPISNLFNWIRRETVICMNNTELNSFQAFPIILFDLDEIFNASLNNKSPLNPNSYNPVNNKIINLDNCFDYYSKIYRQNTEPCQWCGNYHYSNYYIQNSPLYFLIVLNRKDQISLEYSDKLDITNYIPGTENKRNYQLIGVILEDQKNYECLIREKNEESNNWTKFSNEHTNNIGVTQDNYKEIFHPIKSRILLYKAIQG